MDPFPEVLVKSMVVAPEDSFGEIRERDVFVTLVITALRP